jgi:DNA-binding Lrp family transcriptional regulator
MNSEDADCIDLGYKEIHSQLGISKSVAIKSVKSLEDNNKIIKVSGVQHANNSFKLHPELLNQFI